MPVEEDPELAAPAEDLPSRRRKQISLMSLDSKGDRDREAVLELVELG